MTPLSSSFLRQELDKATTTSEDVLRLPRRRFDDAAIEIAGVNPKRRQTKRRRRSASGVVKVSVNQMSPTSTPYYLRGGFQTTTSRLEPLAVMRFLKGLRATPVIRSADELLGRLQRENAEDGGPVVSPASLELARQVLESLPRADELPEATIYDDGLVGLDWFGTGRAILSVIAGSDGFLIFAGRKGQEKNNGRELWLGLLPPSILDWIRRVRS